MIKYGTTWWGRQWLNSLTRIDFSNRLPRGRSYARKGAVTKIEINRNKIIAKVKGSRPKPYHVEIEVPLFSKEQTIILQEIIRDNPQLLSKLLNKELDPALDNLAQNKGIRLFPASWKYLGMTCSCPDWAVPCKHLAAVLYIVANEIDKNPFILFNLHGLDLLEEFKEKDEAPGASTIDRVETLLSQTGDVAETPFDAGKVTDIDLSGLSVNPPEIITLLSPSPVFYPSDFRTLLQKATHSVARNIKNQNVQHEHITINPESKVTIVFNEDLSLCAAEISDDKLIVQISVEKLISLLSGIQDKQLGYLHPTWVYLHKIYLFSLQLALNKLYYPRIWQADADTFVLKYLPSVFCDEVKMVFDKLSVFNIPRLIEVRRADKKKGNTVISAISQQLPVLCSIFLGWFVKSTYDSGNFPAQWYERQNSQETIDLFTTGYVQGFDTFETSQIPASIHQWLSIFDIHSRAYTPVLQVEEDKHGFALSLLVSENNGKLSSPVPLSDVFKLKKYDKIRLDILKDISLVGNYLPQVNTLLSAKGETNVVVALPDFSVILTNVLPLIKLLGVKILLPKSLKSLVHPYLSLQIRKAPGKQVSVKSLVGLTELFDYNWQVAVGDSQMDINEFLRLVKGLHGLVKLKDQYIFLDEAELKSLQKNMDRNTELSPHQLLQALFSEELHGIKVGLTPEVVKAVQKLLKGSPPSLPAGLQATLRPYQQRGFEWLARNAALGMGSIIADDMGLGKTIQVICLLLHYKNQGLLIENKALVVVPTTLISNWEREIARFAPSLSVYAYHGTGRNSEFSNFDIIITSYGLVRNNPDVFQKLKWKLLIVDEAQNIKNHMADQTKAIKGIKADIRVAMSGTPVENRLSEYWSIFDFVNKGYLGSFNTFNEEFAKPIHFNHDMAKVEHFKRITAPFLLRRLKTDKSIISDLPDKVESNYYATLSPVQAALYQNIVDQTIAQIEGSEGIERKGLVLKLIIALKQIGNHPYQYIRQGNKDIGQSGKSQLFAELLRNITESGDKVLVFTQFKEMGDLLTQFVERITQMPPLFLHGGCSRKQRDEMVDKFQNSHNQVFILSLKAGGTGLNLTAASHVIHYDLWWNPAVETQATDRTYRIGQKKNVQVYRLINKGTIEEKIDNMIREKRYLADLTVASGETWLGNLSNEELRELVKL